jgi:hypothetical protein
MATPAACPLNSRRGETEVFIKRVAVMVTVLCLLGHLNSLRGIKSSQRLTMSILLALFNPAYPLCTLLFDIGWAILKPRSDSRWRDERFALLGLMPDTTSSQSGEPDGVGPPEHYIAAAIGVHATHDTHPMDGIQETSTSLLRVPHSVTRAEKENDVLQGSQRIGRLIVLGVAALQCSATMLLGIRRELRGAGTPSDRRYCLFAASGMAILAQTLVAQLLSRTYIRKRAAGLEVKEYGESIFVEVLHYLGSLSLVSYFAGDAILNSRLMLAAIPALNSFGWLYGTFIDGFDWVLWRKLQDDPKGMIWDIFVVAASGLAMCWNYSSVEHSFPWRSGDPYS